MNAAQRQRLEQLLETKPFEALTADERDLVYEEFGSEEQYTLARKVGQALVRNSATLSPDPWVLQSLKQRLRARHVPVWWQQLALARVPAYVLGLVCLAGAGLVVLMMTNDAPPPVASDIRTVVMRDTVYVASEPDTVYKQKIVYRTRIKVVETPVYVNVPVPVYQSTPELSMESASRKEKEELEKLLVSGSDKD